MCQLPLLFPLHWNYLSFCNSSLPLIWQKQLGNLFPKKCWSENFDMCTLYLYFLCKPMVLFCIASQIFKQISMISSAIQYLAMTIFFCELKFLWLALHDKKESRREDYKPNWVFPWFMGSVLFDSFAESFVMKRAPDFTAFAWNPPKELNSEKYVKKNKRQQHLTNLALKVVYFQL